MGHIKCSALIDTGANRNCIREAYYHTIIIPDLKHLLNMTNTSDSVNNLQPLKLLILSFTLGQRPFTFDFIVCKHLQRPLFLYQFP